MQPTLELRDVPLAIQHDKGGWTCVATSEAQRVFGTARAIKASGTIDGIAVNVTLLPIGGGQHMVPVKAELRKKLGKAAGDTVCVYLQARQDA